MVHDLSVRDARSSELLNPKSTDGEFADASSAAQASSRRRRSFQLRAW